MLLNSNNTPAESSTILNGKIKENNQNNKSQDLNTHYLLKDNGNSKSNYNGNNEKSKKRE